MYRYLSHEYHYLCNLIGLHWGYKSYISVSPGPRPTTSYPIRNWWDIWLWTIEFDHFNPLRCAICVFHLPWMFTCAGSTPYLVYASETFIHLMTLPVNATDTQVRTRIIVSGLSRAADIDFHYRYISDSRMHNLIMRLLTLYTYGCQDNSSQ